MTLYTGGLDCWWYLARALLMERKVGRAMAMRLCMAGAKEQKNRERLEAIRFAAARRAGARP